mmetsp:Transcript_25178/g.39267  ORF Transcript_25178/g.39267 Transcript_25178/m.39267 type:complete len:217 (-) Transcript_25178:30-680(-)
MASEDEMFDDSFTKGDDWEMLFEREDAWIKRKYEEEGNLYRFYTRGILKGVTSKLLFDVSMDLDYRTSWDANTPKCETFTEDVTDEEGHVVQHVYWVIKYPWPMSSRDYVCLRKSKKISDTVYSIVSESIERQEYPAAKTCGVRVATFDSKLYMRCTGDGNCEFVSIYYEDPGGSVPKWLINWAVKTAVPKGLDDLRGTALGYEKYLEKNEKKKKK